MKTLIVDDQYQDKAQVIAAALKQVGVLDPLLVTSSKEALRKMRDEKFDLLILDLQIPENIGDDPVPDGGKQLLEYIELNSIILKPTSVLAITSHQDSYDSCQSFFQSRGWTILLGVEDLDKLHSILLTQKIHLSAAIESFDVAIITALANPELDAVLELPCGWTRRDVHGDDNIYHTGTFLTSDGQPKTIIATCAPHMGMAAAAALAATVCVKFKPSLLVMTGIAAGVEGKVDIGDILVADPSWDWGSGKLTVRDNKVVFLSAPTQIPLDPAIRKGLQYVSAGNLYMNDIYSSWRRGRRPPNEPKLYLGPVATGAVVLEDPETVDLIKTQNRNTIGVEMEAFGVMSAAYYSGPGRPKAIAIKSVCDFADPNKNNDWQEYAAYTSAQAAFLYIKNHFLFS